MADLQNVNLQKYIDLPEGGTNSRPSSPQSGMIRYNTDIGSAEFYDGFEWLGIDYQNIGDPDNPGVSAQQIKNLKPGADDGIYFIKPSSNSPTFPVYCDMSTAGGGWMHMITFSDRASLSTSSGKEFHMWGYWISRDYFGNIIYDDNFIGIWGNDEPLGPQSFTNNYKHTLGWKYVPFSQILMKDQGDNLRNLWYTDPGEIDTTYSTNLLTFFNNGGNGGDVWKLSSNSNDNRNQATASPRYSVTNFGVSDDVFGSNPPDVNFFLGETTTQEVGNNDKSMITRGSNSNRDVSLTQGIGVSRVGNGNNLYRNIDPNFRDSPGNINTDYNYTMWIR